MNRERFHNALAMALGYEQLMKIQRYNIIEDDSADELKIVIKDDLGINLFSFKVSEVERIINKSLDISNSTGSDKDLIMILNAVHQAYLKATKQPF